MDPELNEGQPAAAPAAEAAAAPAPAPAPEPTLEEAALAALDEGLAAEQPAAAAAKSEPEESAADPVPGTPEAAAAEAAKAEAAKAEAAKKGEGEPAKPERDEALEKEITDLGLKEKSAERFRSMAGEIKTMAPFKEALEKAGIKDAAELPQLAQHAQFGRELYQQVQETGATAEQYGMSLDYLRVVTRANQGDVKAAEQAFEIVQEELTNLAKLLGKDIPGVVDPLADHPDLLQQVKDSDLPRAAALETARLRNAAKLEEGRRQIDAQRGSQQAEETKAVADLNTLGAELAGSDPHYQAKAPALLAALQEIRASVPPTRWVATARALYARLPNPAPAPAPAPAAAPAPAKPVPGPVRGNTVRPAVMPVTDDPLEALEQGIAAADG